MSGLFSTLNTSNRGLTANERSLGTVGHNIANANTRGYSRQRVEMQADLPYRLPGVGKLGTGVVVTSITRSVSSHTNRQLRNQLGALSMYGTKSENIGELEGIFHEPSETGFNSVMSEMFNSWSALSQDPELGSAKSVVVEKSKTFADIVNSTLRKMENLNSDINKDIEGNIGEFNRYLEQLETLNKEIAKSTVQGEIPNDLLDQRDLIMEDMSEIMDFEASFDNLDRVSIKIGDTEVLDSKEKLGTMTVENGKIKFVTKDGEDVEKKVDITDKIKSGNIKGSLESIDEIDGKISEFKNFVKTTVEEINKTHQKGENKIDFFDINSDGTIKVNDKILKDSTKVNAGNSNLEGDGSLALEISKLQDKEIEFDNGNMNIKDKYADIASQIAVSKRHNDDMLENQLSVTEQAYIKQQSISGVNMNEEITDMIKFQQGYNANARVIQTITEMLDTLINRTGV